MAKVCRFVPGTLPLYLPPILENMNGHKPTVATNVQTQDAAPGNRVQGTEKLTFYFKKIIFSS